MQDNSTAKEQTHPSQHSFNKQDTSLKQNTNSSHRTSTQKSNSKDSLKTLAIILVTVVVSVAGVLLYQHLFEDNSKKGKKTTQQMNQDRGTAISPMPSKQTNKFQNKKDDDKLTASPTINANTITDWKTYISQNDVYKLEHPADWSIKDDSKYITINGDGSDTFVHKVTISKKSHSFLSYQPPAWSPTICLFPDSKNSQGEVMSLNFHDYMEVSTSNTKYRISKNDGVTSNLNLENNRLKWTICSKNEDGDYFSTSSPMGKVWFETPKDYDQELVETMMQILKTYTKIK
jgi:hypothetical protein